MSDIKLKKTGIIVSHTHWDRAWYLTFQQFRHRMVRMVDRLIDLLQNNPDYHSFTLDGQTILLDDYLEIKPYNEQIVQNLISSGKLVVGPWYILPDMFLVSGESVIRNLQIGLATAQKYGASMQEGYVPDPFGHFAQLPQILTQFGIDSFIFMRGLDEKSKNEAGSIFVWQAPDGSEVLTTYLVDGYFNGAALGYPEQFGRFDGLIPNSELAKNRIKEAISKLSDLQEESTFLINNGFDHMPEQPELPDLIKSVNLNGNGTILKHGTFKDFFDGVRKEGRNHKLISGDLLGNVDHPILSSVFSTRTYLKQQNHRAQSLLERYVEPLLLWSRHNTSQEDASDFMNYAWKLLLQNHPHDDICGCSADGVHEDDEVRFRQVNELSHSLMVEQMESILRTGLRKPSESSDKSSDVFVYNPHPWNQKVRVSTKILIANPNAEKGEQAPQFELKAVDANGNEIDLHVTYSHPHTLRNNFLESSWGRRYDVHFEVDVPALGYHIVHIFETDVEVTNKSAGSKSVPHVPLELASSEESPDIHIDTLPVVEALQKSESVYPKYANFASAGTELNLKDGMVSVNFDETANSFKDFIRFEYQHDNGDTYTFGPVPEKGVYWAKLKAASVDPSRKMTLLLHHELEVPASLNSRERVLIDISTQVTLEPNGSLSFDTKYENTAKDGRLRIILPTGISSKTAFADGHFRVAQRVAGAIRTPESDPDRYKAYPGELDYPTMHMNDFVYLKNDTKCTWIASRGLHEFELLEENGETFVALTVHRAVGLLSTSDGRIRRCQAGPSIPVPGAQCLRTIEAHVGFGCVPANETGKAARFARSFAHPAWSREMPYLPHLKSDGDLARLSGGLSIDNPEVELSSFRLHPDGETAVLRVYNNSEKTQKTAILTILPYHKWVSADLRERWNDRDVQTLKNDKVIHLILEPHQIATVLLR